ncbi:MAG: glycosyltransferase [Flavobacteriia bacterium]|nr:glycosyltransferase [Flavobacteriia bacterium]
MDTNQIFFILFALVAGVQFIYWVVVFSRFAFKKPHEAQQADLLPPVSVVVVGRNEAENFRKNLPAILNQDYPNFEVVAVNDQSSDDSEEVIEALQEEYPNLRLVKVPENDKFWNGKKFGLALGIKATQNEHLLLTDADCYPSSPDWIKEMISGFMGGKEIVLGYGDVEKTGGFVNALSRFETMQTALQYFAWSFWGMTYMGVGRNLAYRKSLWFQQNGFIKHIHIPSGDDDLFINAAAKVGKVGRVAKNTAHTITESKTTWKGWIRQKRRHFSTSSLYKPHQLIILGIYGSSVLAFWPTFVLALIFTDGMLQHLVLGMAGLRLVYQYTIGFMASRFFAHKDVVALWPIYELIWALSGMYLHFVNAWKGKPKGWK